MNWKKMSLENKQKQEEITLPFRNVWMIDNGRDYKRE